MSPLVAQTFETSSIATSESSVPVPSAAVLLLEEEAEDPVLAEELDDVPGELVRLVDLGRARGDPLARDRAHELADLELLVGQRLPGHGRIVRGPGMPGPTHQWASGVTRASPLCVALRLDVVAVGIEHVRREVPARRTRGGAQERRCRCRPRQGAAA